MYVCELFSGQNFSEDVLSLISHHLLSDFCHLGHNSTPLLILTGPSLSLGFGTKHRLRQLVSAEDVSQENCRVFYRNMLCYCEAITRYLLSHLPLDDSFLMELQWLDPSKASIDSEAVISCALR